MKIPSQSDFKKQLRQMEKEKRAVLRPVRKFIAEGYGRRCKHFNALCSTCQAWHAFDILNSL